MPPSEVSSETLGRETTSLSWGFIPPLAGEMSRKSGPDLAITNEYRRRSLQAMVGQVNPSVNIDDVHRDMLDLVIGDHGLGALTADDREAIIAPGTRSTRGRMFRLPSHGCDRSAPSFPSRS